MKNYELVLMLKVSITEAERKAVISEIESKYKVLDKDEIGIKDLYYTVKGGIRQAYFVSFSMELSADDIADLKKSLLYNPTLIHYEIFAREANQEFFHFEKLQASFEKAIEDIKDRKFGQKVTFFSKAENAKYLNWKSITILKYYLTRFGDIKPRQYTWNSIATQKTLRKEIIRARTLGLLPFINR